jgi:hypothetical protein
MLPPALSDRRFFRPRLDRAWPHCIELIRKTRYRRRHAIRNFARIRQADEPVNDVHDTFITADHARVNDVHATI